MRDKPDDYPREYFEVHCTSLEKAQLQNWANASNMALSPYVRAILFPPDKKIPKKLGPRKFKILTKKKR